MDLSSHTFGELESLCHCVVQNHYYPQSKCWIKSYITEKKNPLALAYGTGLPLNAISKIDIPNFFCLNLLTQIWFLIQ